MRVLVCGGRSFSDEKLLNNTLAYIQNRLKESRTHALCS